jgi:magnesium transporter
VDDRVVWVDLLDPDAATLDAALPGGEHRTVLERLQQPPRHDDEPRPRLETHGDYVFGVLVVPVLIADERRIVYQEVDLVAAIDTLVTVRKTPQGGVAFGLAEVRAGALKSGAGPGMCLYLLLDEVAERYLSLVDGFDDNIDDLEDNVETRRAAELRGQIGELRHDMLHVRRVLAPTRDAARAVLDNRVELDGDQELFPHDVELHFADAYDKLLRATDGLDLSRDLLAGVRDYHQAQVSNDQNEVMKRLTVVASLLLLPTFIVGLYGQNLKGSPELSFRYGYAFSWALIIVTTIGQLIYFRRKRWI